VPLGITWTKAKGETRARSSAAIVSPLAFVHVIPNGTYLCGRGGRISVGAYVHLMTGSTTTCNGGPTAHLHAYRKFSGVCSWRASLVSTPFFESDNVTEFAEAA